MELKKLKLKPAVDPTSHVTGGAKRVRMSESTDWYLQSIASRGATGAKNSVHNSLRVLEYADLIQS